MLHIITKARTFASSCLPDFSISWMAHWELFGGSDVDERKIEWDKLYKSASFFFVDGWCAQKNLVISTNKKKLSRKLTPCKQRICRFIPLSHNSKPHMSPSISLAGGGNALVDNSLPRLGSHLIFGGVEFGEDAWSHFWCFSKYERQLTLRDYNNKEFDLTFGI